MIDRLRYLLHIVQAPKYAQWFNVFYQSIFVKYSIFISYARKTVNTSFR